MKREEYKQLRKRRIRFRNAFIGAGALLFVAAMGLLALMFGGALFVSDDDLMLDTASTVTADGEEIEQIYSVNRTLVNLDEVPEFLQQAFIATEDSRFYEHSGIDPRGIARALYRDIIAWEKVEGASTITQQVAKNLFFTNEKSWMRKTKEVMVALYLERNLTKEEILELYVNSIYFGEGTYGVEAASERYFGTSVSDVTQSQAALLAGMPKAPNSYSPVNDPEAAKDRRDVVLMRMEDESYISGEERENLSNQRLEYKEKTQPEETWSNAYVNAVVQEAVERYGISREALKTEGYRIEVNMHPEAQRIAYDTMQDASYASGSVKGVEGAFVLTDQSGKVTAIVGGRSYEHGESNHALTKHQPGSVMKPLAVYGPALMSDRYTPYSVLKDEETSYGDYTPSNVTGGYEGQVTMYEALVESKNAPAVWLFDQIGVGEGKTYLEKLGLSTEDEGLSIALGGLSEGFTPMEIAGAYQTIGNGGERRPLQTIATITDRNGEAVEPKEQAEATRVFNEETAFQLREMMETVVSEGTATSGSYQGPLAGKTGTAGHPSVEGQNRDVWFAGITPNYTMSMWMGYEASGEDYYLTDSSSVPTSLSKELMTNLKEVIDPGTEFTNPEGMDSLQKPVELPDSTELQGTLDIGGWAFVQGELNWEAPEDERVTYRVYRARGNDPELIAETEATSHTVQAFGLLESRTYFVVPYDPTTGREGERSNEVTLSW
ncbi:transglycosylase domain-containing protein [Salimicrobium halophilum]|uniref:Penicillin-binding protein 2A n=1 Tax=Salimicrobium halophilum TaxID=86666 RepID=A0A1G8TPV2_9BACI|nr:PBP1A family penicillin-binding protein [Salimicrobium halophilum]SDJ43569.1 penicillin-binding protein 2A [Salimicrobium halophilum]